MPDLFKNKYRIASTRLKNWDYGIDGHYFVTICTKDRRCYFGDIENDAVKLSVIGRVARRCWREIPKHFPFVKLDGFVIMPNHVHGIVVIEKDVETQDFASLQAQARVRSWGAKNRGAENKFGPQSQNLASIIRGFKIGVKKWATINKRRFQWQSRFYDHIIRNEGSLNRIRRYILDNPLDWERDRNNPEGLYF